MKGINTLTASTYTEHDATRILKACLKILTPSDGCIIYLVGKGFSVKVEVQQDTEDSYSVSTAISPWGHPGRWSRSNQFKNLRHREVVWLAEDTFLYAATCNSDQETNHD